MTDKKGEKHWDLLRSVGISPGYGDVTLHFKLQGVSDLKGEDLDHVEINLREEQVEELFEDLLRMRELRSPRLSKLASDRV